MNRKKTVQLESREILCEKLAYKKKMVAYYESQLKQEESKVVKYSFFPIYNNLEISIVLILLTNS